MSLSLNTFENLSVIPGRFYHQR